MSDATFSVEELALPGVLLLKPKVFADTRGFSAVPYSEEDFAQIGIVSRFVQDYVSVSRKGVIRGLHFQKAPHAQDKLVRCSSGEMFDVAVDFDPLSSTFGTHAAATLTAKEQAMLYIPGKYAHGFCVISETATTEYKLSDQRYAELEGGIRWNDPAFGIAWPIQSPILSEKDAAWPLLPVAPHR